MLFQTLFLQWNAKEDIVKMSQDPLFLFIFLSSKKSVGSIVILHPFNI